MQEKIIIKKYNNRRLYNTKTSNYINFQDILELIRQQIDFVVLDAKTSQDLTHSTMVQIILEQESQGYNLLPTAFLKQILLLHDEKTSYLIRSFLENFVSMFNQYQQNPALKSFEDAAKQNFKFFEQAFHFFNKDQNGTK